LRSWPGRGGLARREWLVPPNDVAATMNAVAPVVSDRDGLTDEFLRSACIRAASSPLKGESNDVADGVGFDQESVVSEL
jgi:hypothetical protein